MGIDGRLGVALHDDDLQSGAVLRGRWSALGIVVHTLQGADCLDCDHVVGRVAKVNETVDRLRAFGCTEHIKFS